MLRVTFDVNGRDLVQVVIRNLTPDPRRRHCDYSVQVYTPIPEGKKVRGLNAEVCHDPSEGAAKLVQLALASIEPHLTKWMERQRTRHQAQLRTSVERQIKRLWPKNES